MKRRIVVTLTALGVVLAFSTPVAQAAPVKGKNTVVTTVDCDGDGIAGTTVAVVPPPAAEGSAAFLRPAQVAHIIDSTEVVDSSQVSVGIFAEFLFDFDDDGTIDAVVAAPPPPGVRQVGIGTGRWANGVEPDLNCSFIAFAVDADDDGNLELQLRVTVLGFGVPRTPNA